MKVLSKQSTSHCYRVVVKEKQELNKHSSLVVVRGANEKHISPTLPNNTKWQKVASKRALEPLISHIQLLYIQARTKSVAKCGGVMNNQRHDIKRRSLTHCATHDSIVHKRLRKKLAQGEK